MAINQVCQDLLPGAGQPARYAFRCEGGCLVNAAARRYCCPVSTPRYALKMPNTWRGLKGLEGERASDVAQYCEQCWRHIFAVVTEDLDEDLDAGRVDAHDQDDAPLLANTGGQLAAETGGAAAEPAQSHPAPQPAVGAGAPPPQPAALDQLVATMACPPTAAAAALAACGNDVTQAADMLLGQPVWEKPRPGLVHRQREGAALRARAGDAAGAVVPPRTGPPAPPPAPQAQNSVPVAAAPLTDANTVRTSPFSSFCFFACFVCLVFPINLTLFVSATACDYAFRSTAPEHCSTRYTGSNSLPLAAAPRTDANAVRTSSSSFSCFFVCFVCFVFSSMVNLTLFVSAAGCVSAFLNTSGVRLLAERF